MFGLRITWMCAAVIAIAGCEPVNAAFQVTGFTPTLVNACDREMIKIDGEGFHADVRVVLDSDDSPVVERGFEIVIGGVTIDTSQVNVESATAIEVTVPPGTLPADTHEVVVIAPSGARRTLPRLLTAYEDCGGETIGQGNCEDGDDNDFDGLIDGDDPGCMLTGNRPPIAAFSVSPGAGTPMTEFVLDATGSFDPDGDDQRALDYIWHFDDDGVPDATGPIVTAADYATPGRQAVSLEVRDPHGHASWFTGYVVVADPDELIIVDTSADVEADDGVTSLREAVVRARQSPGPDVIGFSGPMVIALGSGLQAVGDSGPVHIVGERGVVITRVGVGLSPCIEIMNGSSVLWLEVMNCFGVAIRVRTDDNLIAHAVIRDSNLPVMLEGSGSVFGPDNQVFSNAGIGVLVSGRGHVVTRNRIFGNGDIGVSLQSNAADIRIDGNTIYGNQERGIHIASGVGDVAIWHNTVYENGTTGVYVSANAARIDIRNNIVVAHSESGVRALTLPQALSNNLYFDNAAACVGCEPGPGAIEGVEPLFIDTASGSVDLRVESGSPGRDRGAALDVDANGGGARNGLFYGQASDIGAWEIP